MPYDLKDEAGRVVATFEQPPTDKDIDEALNASKPKIDPALARQQAREALGYQEEGPFIWTNKADLSYDESGRPQWIKRVPAAKAPALTKAEAIKQMSALSDPEQYAKNIAATGAPVGEMYVPSKSPNSLADILWNKPMSEIGQSMSNPDPTEKERMIVNAFIATLPQDVLAKEAVKGVKAIARGVGKGATRQPARLMNVSPNSPEATTPFEQGLNPTSGNMQGQVEAAQKELYPEIENLLTNAQPVNTADAINNPAVTAWARIQSRAPGSPSAEQAAKYVDETFNYPDQMAAAKAQGVKQYLGQTVKNWEKSPIKEEALSGRAAGQRAAYKGLNETIANATGQPAKYHELNQEYGNLSDLFAKTATGGAPQPAEVADIAMANKPLINLPNTPPFSWIPGVNKGSALGEKIMWPINKARYAIGKWGASGNMPPTSPVGAAGATSGPTPPSTPPAGTTPPMPQPGQGGAPISSPSQIPAGPPQDLAAIMRRAPSGKDLIEAAGMRFEGVTPVDQLPKALASKGEMYWFTDPQTGSTLSMHANELTPESLMMHILQHRKGF